MVVRNLVMSWILGSPLARARKPAHGSKELGDELETSCHDSQELGDQRRGSEELKET